MPLKVLRLADIGALLAQKPSQSPLKPDDKQSADYQCLTCFELKPDQMVLCYECTNIFCASCIIKALTDPSSVSSAKLCSYCKLDWTKVDVADTFTTLPIPTIKAIDHIEYHCDSCATLHSYQNSLRHHQDCPGLIRHQPIPDHVPRRGTSNVARVEVISNCSDVARVDTAKKHIICHVNGNQLFAHSFNRNHTGEQILTKISKKTKLIRNNIKLFIFSHQEVHPESKIGETIAPREGTCYISAFTHFEGLNQRSANLLLEEVGARHYLPPQPSPPWHPPELTLEPGDWRPTLPHQASQQSYQPPPYDDDLSREQLDALMQNWN